MKIILWNSAPLHAIPFRQAGSGGRVSSNILEITTAQIEGIPTNLDGLIVTSDLQGRGFDERLLGEVAAEEIFNLCEAGLLPNSNKLGVLLCGDFYASPILQRGISGPVDEVWQAFANRFRWAVGVLGNHDTFNEKPEFLLQGETAEKDGLKIGGIGGIIGESGKGLQISAREFEGHLQKIVQQRPDLLLLHSAPQLSEKTYFGDATVNQFLQKNTAPLTFCGHCHWPSPLQQLNAHTQICNVDGRVIVLLRSDFR